MYTLIRCHVKRDFEWKSIDASHLTLKQLYETYSEIRVFLENDENDLDEGVVELHLYYPGLNEVDQHRTLANWIGTLTIAPYTPELNAVPLDRIGAMRCRDLWSHPIEVAFGHHLYGPDADIPKGMETDLVLTAKSESSTIIEEMAQHMLITINGRIVRTELVGDRLFIHNARRFFEQQPDRFLTSTTIDLRELGPFEWFPIHDGVLSRIPRTGADVENRRSKFKVTLPQGNGFAGKTALLVVDGHPHFLNSHFRIFDAYNGIINLSHKQEALRMLMDGEQYWQGADGINVRNTGIDVETLDLYPYLTSGTSALILIDNNDIAVQKRLAGRTDIPNSYTFPYPPQGMLILEDGTMSDYQIEGYDGDQAAITVLTNVRKHFMHDHIRQGDRQIVTCSQRKSAKLECMEAHFLDLYIPNNTA